MEVHVPPKSNTLWRVCNNCLATCHNLFLQKCAAENQCQVCHHAVESTEHLLVGCEWTQAIWFGIGLGFWIDFSPFQSIQMWLSGIMDNLDNSQDRREGISRVA